MQLITCMQGSEQWEMVRRGKATCSRFSEIVTPKKLEFSRQSKAYAIELVAEILGVATEPRLPSYDMELGTEREPLAREEYREASELEVTEVGFCLADSGRWGGSPDGLVGDDGLLEIKCVQAETMLSWILRDELPSEHFAQVQGLLWVTGRKWCDFYVWHPDLEPWSITVRPDRAFHAALDEALPQFTNLVDELLAKTIARKRGTLGLIFDGVDCE